jgi:hypothetical protein
MSFLSKENPTFFRKNLVIFLILLISLPLALYLVRQATNLLPKAGNGDPTDTSYQVNVLVLKYFPLTEDGINIDLSVTGDVGEPYDYIRQRTIDQTARLVESLEKATTYRGYENPYAQPALNYEVIDTKEYTKAVPIKPLNGFTRYPDYKGIMEEHNICDYVENQGVREVWIWAYHGPNKSDGQPHLSISESKMSGPNGDISNSYQFGEMPVCNTTYTVLTFNYQRGTAEALHSWGHQIEEEIQYIDWSLFNLWQGPTHPQLTDETGRCGSVHNPPNAADEYDYQNTSEHPSDCLDWNPDSQGTITNISCNLWGCNDNSDTDNPQLNYMIWNWQNLPGRGNTKVYQSNLLRNWWDIHGDFDNVIQNKRTLFQEIPPSPSPFLPPPPIKHLPPVVTNLVSCLPDDGLDTGNLFRIDITRGITNPDIYMELNQLDIEVYPNSNSDYMEVPYSYTLENDENTITGPEIFKRLGDQKLKIKPNKTYNVQIIAHTRFGRTINSDVINFTFAPCGLPSPVPSPTSKIGDANGDGSVDALDFGLIVEQYEQTGPNLQGDVNNDGVVDVLDFGLVVEYYDR